MRRTVKNIVILGFILLIWPTFGQVHKPIDNSQIEKWVNKGLSAYDQADYETAEQAFRKVLTIDPLNAVAAYNLGLTDVELDKKLEAAHFFKKAAQTAAGDNLKSKAFFNQGNIWYQKKQYEKAVEAYKNALRHNPADEEARYNLALAQMKLKKQQKNNKNKKNKNKNKKQNQQKKQNQNKNQQNKQNKQNQKNKSKEKGKQDKNQKNGRNQKKQDQQNKKEKNKQGKGDQKNKQQNNQNKEQNKQNNKPNKGQQKQPNGGQGQQKQSNRKPVPRKGQLTPQQVKQILVALKNKEQKTQKKIKAKILKGSGRKRKQDKDW